MYPQSDAGLVSFAKRELDKERPDLAMVYLSEVRDPTTPGLAEARRRLEEVQTAPRQGLP